MADSKTTSSLKSIEKNTILNSKTKEMFVKNSGKFSEFTINKSHTENGIKIFENIENIPIPSREEISNNLSGFQHQQNKLKRKKKSTTPTTSIENVSTILTTKKRKTKLSTSSGVSELEVNLTNQQNIEETFQEPSSSQQIVMEVTQKKPPLPPKPEKILTLGLQHLLRAPPPRLKRKLDEQNSQLVQKLNAHTEQMRMEITELKIALANEKSAVRTLRAQHESDARKSKNEIKKLQNALELCKKLNVVANLTVSHPAKKIKDEQTVATPGSLSGKDATHNGALDFEKLQHELQMLKESNKALEEKIQMLTEAERRKNNDLRVLKDSYENRLTRLSKSAKIEINRLLEEIKAKDRNIGQLNKEIHTLHHTKIITIPNEKLNSKHGKKDVKHNAQHPPEMKNLKEIECKNASYHNHSEINDTNKINDYDSGSITISPSSSSSSIQNHQITTCEQKDSSTLPHEINERIKNDVTENNHKNEIKSHLNNNNNHQHHQNELHIQLSNKDSINGSDSDSALSSAPQSISPQPLMMSDGDGIRNTVDIWQSMKIYTKEITNLQNDNDSLLKENQQLKTELEMAKQQIDDLEKTVLVLRDRENPKILNQQKRIKSLELKANDLVQEIHELREQNELLEFRIIELEESHEKWSLQSNSTPADTRDMWTDTEKETCDDPFMYSASNTSSGTSGCSAGDRSDSGIISPHSHHLVDDRNMISPSDISMFDHLSQDEIRRRIQGITKRPGLDEDDKLCLLQLLSWVNNLEALSNDSILSNDEIMMAVDLDQISATPKTSDYNSSSTSPSPRSFLCSSTTLDTSYKSKNAGRIVATVLPYSSALSTPPNESPRKLRSWNTSSLQESGVFVEGDDPNETFSQCTQTVLEDFPCQDDISTGDLCAEIQKLNKFREKIEECVTKSSTKKPTVILSPNLSDQKRLQYYKERLELLENKVLIYESSGDLQAKRLAERLQREIQLESLAKELRQRVECLEEENHRLEEERCELEEAENDTRLRLQRLEVDLEIFSQRNVELEISKETIQFKLKEARNQISSLDETVRNCENRLKTFEQSEFELIQKLKLIKETMPAILVYNAFKTMFENRNAAEEQQNNGGEASSCFHCKNNKMAVATNEFNQSLDYHGKMHELLSREKILQQNINELNRAYNETLENADNLWAQMEKDYRDRLMAANANESCLKSKITQLEQRLACDAQCAQERICQLEENELAFKHRLCKLNKENKELIIEKKSIQTDYQALKDKFQELKNYLEGPTQDALEREKQKVRSLGEDLALAKKMLNDTEDVQKTELTALRTQLTKVNKELLHIEVSNAELKEEVHTLETRIAELTRQTLLDEDKLKNLSDELKNKEHQLMSMKPAALVTGPSLAQELTNPLPSPTIKRVGADDIKDLSNATNKLKQAMANIEECEKCSTKNSLIKDVAKEIHALAELFTTKSEKKKKFSTEQLFTRFTNDLVQDS